MVISDKKAIREALVTKSTVFADRPPMRIGSIFDPRKKGISSAMLLLARLHIG